MHTGGSSCNCQSGKAIDPQRRAQSRWTNPGSESTYFPRGTPMPGKYPHLLMILSGKQHCVKKKFSFVSVFLRLLTHLHQNLRQLALPSVWLEFAPCQV